MFGSIKLFLQKNFKNSKSSNNICQTVNIIVSNYFYFMLNAFSDRMAKIMKEEIDLEEFEIKEELISENEEILPPSTVKDTCTVNLHKDVIKIDKTEIQGKPNGFIK